MRSLEAADDLGFELKILLRPPRDLWRCVERVSMGAWGYNAFENDDALTWPEECVKSNNPSEFVQRSFTKIAADADAIDSRRAIAAAELVVKSRGHGAREIPAELLVWLDETCFRSTAELKRLSIQSVNSVVECSELRELWKGQPAWHASCRRLLERLRRAERKRAKRTSKSVPQTAQRDSQSAIVKFIRDQNGFVFFAQRKPNHAGFDSNCKVSKKLFQAFSQVVTLDAITLAGRSFPAEWMVLLKDLPSLNRLDLSHSPAGDAHLRSAAELPRLWFLDLSWTNVTDQGLQYLSSCKALEILDIGRSKVTLKGIAKPQGQLPNLKDIRGMASLE